MINRIIFRLAFLTACLGLLASCGTPRVRTEIVEVPRIQYVICKPAKVPVEVYPADTMALGLDIWEQTKILLADREARKAVEAKLRAANGGVECPTN